jgi:general secretion pathway protein D
MQPDSRSTASPKNGLENFADILNNRSPVPAAQKQGAAAAARGAGDVNPRQPSRGTDQAVIYAGEEVARRPSAVSQVGPTDQQAEPSFRPVAFNVADTGVAPVQGDRFQVVFENADIGAVARAILGDSLKLNYTVDPRVRGTISLSAQRPVTRRQLLWILEEALRSAGAVLADQDGVYRIALASDARSIGGTNIGPDAGSQGFGITALPLQNISADALNKLLNGFGAAPESVHVEPNLNLLVVRGSSSERQWLIDTALAFDVDWMRKQSVGVFPIKNSSPEVLINEINQLAPDPSLYKLQPIARLNGILVVAKSADGVRQVQTWINRLDRRNDYGPNVHVYRLKSADARKVVTVLREVFGGGSTSTTELAVTGGGPVPIARMPNGQPPPVPVDNSNKSDGLIAISKPSQIGGGAPSEGSSASKIRISADTASNAVIVYASQEDYKSVQRVITELDQRSPDVAIEAIAAEITLNDNLNYGVQFYLNGLIKGSGNGTPISGSQLSVPLPLAQVIPGANLVVGALANPNVVLNALRSVTDVKVLSSPSLVVANNQPAILQVGAQVPVTTGTATSVVTTQSAVVNSVSYVDTGVILRVTPHIGRTGEIRLDIEQEVSGVQQNANANTLTPTITQQKIKSTVNVDSGQTLLLAGLISQQISQEKSGIPGLIDIPLFGNVGSNSTNTATRKELIVFVQPRVVRRPADAERIAEDLKRRMPGFNTW